MEIVKARQRAWGRDGWPARYAEQFAKGRGFHARKCIGAGSAIGIEPDRDGALSMERLALSAVADVGCGCGSAAFAAHACRRLHRQSAHDRDQRHRQRAGRSDVVRPPAALLKRARHRSHDRDHIDVAEEGDASRNDAAAYRSLRASAAESAAERERLAGSRRSDEPRS